MAATMRSRQEVKLAAYSGIVGIAIMAAVFGLKCERFSNDRSLRQLQRLGITLNLPSWHSAHPAIARCPPSTRHCSVPHRQHLLLTSDIRHAPFASMRFAKTGSKAGLLRRTAANSTPYSTASLGSNPPHMSANPMEYRQRNIRVISFLFVRLFLVQKYHAMLSNDLVRAKSTLRIEQMICKANTLPFCRVDGVSSFVDRYDAFLIDQFGVLHDGQNAYHDTIHVSLTLSIAMLFPAHVPEHFTNTLIRFYTQLRKHVAVPKSLDLQDFDCQVDCALQCMNKIFEAGKPVLLLSNSSKVNLALRCVWVGLFVTECGSEKGRQHQENDADGLSSKYLRRPHNKVSGTSFEE